MTGCPARGELVGGYVLGALEPAEMDEMRRHVADCPRCGPEVAELVGLPGLLDRIGPDDVPPPAVAPEVEEAVLDRFVRERRRERQARRPFLATRRIAALAAACAAAVALALVLAWPSDDDASGGYARAALVPAGGSEATGMAYASEVSAGTHVSLRARGLRGGRGTLYELWCVRDDGRWVSGGTFRAGRDGRAQAELTAAVRPGDYHVMVVTRGSGEPRRTPILKGDLRY